MTGTLYKGNNLTKAGAGVMRLDGSNTYTGTTTLAGGVLNLNVGQNGTTSGPMGASGTIALTGGTLQFSANNQYDYSPRFSTAANQLYNIDTNGQNVALSTSALTSIGGALAKFGAGTLTLGNSGNSYSGGTTVYAGTLYVSGASLPGTGERQHGGHPQHGRRHRADRHDWRLEPRQRRHPGHRLGRPIDDRGRGHDRRHRDVDKSRRHVHLRQHVHPAASGRRPGRCDL